MTAPSDTLETDESAIHHGLGGTVPADFARRLERERNEAIREKMQWRTKAWEWERQATQKMALRRELEELLGIKDHAPASDEALEDGMARLRAVIAERDEAKEDAERLADCTCEYFTVWANEGKKPGWISRVDAFRKKINEALAAHQALKSK